MSRKRGRPSEDVAIVLAADVQRVPISGRSPVWNWFHRRATPDGHVPDDTFWCNLCCPGLQGQVDNVPVGKIVLTSKATNQLERHLRNVHKKQDLRGQPGQLKLAEVIPFDKAKNERLLQSFTRNLIIRDLLAAQLLHAFCKLHRQLSVCAAAQHVSIRIGSCVVV